MKRPPAAVVTEGTDSLRCGEATAVETVHRTVSKSRLSNPMSSLTTKKPLSVRIAVISWWGRTDSNHRSETQQIYSLSPLATRELPLILLRSVETEHAYYNTKNSFVKNFFDFV